MADKSIFGQLLAELEEKKNHTGSIERCRAIIGELETLLDARVISYFSTEIGKDENSMVNDEDAFVIENLLSTPSEKKNLALIIHSNGGLALSAERIIEVCRKYCASKDDGSQFYAIVPKKAKSAATIVALGADKIFLRATAELGPVDPQFRIQDNKGNVVMEPAYLFVDAIENLFDVHANSGWLHRKRGASGNANRRLTCIPDTAKLKLLDQCNYNFYVHAKNELGLSDSIIEKIAKQKIAANEKICMEDFNIFKDPHITKSHGRLINFGDLRNNSLYTEKVICRLADAFDGDKDKAEKADSLLWELYVRKRQLLNDAGNNAIKSFDSVEEFFFNHGLKQGQTRLSQKEQESTAEEKQS